MDKEDKKISSETEFIETLITVYRELSQENKERLNGIIIGIYKKYVEEVNLASIKRDETNSYNNNFNNLNEDSQEEKTMRTELNNDVGISIELTDQTENPYEPVTRKDASNFLKSLISLAKIKFF